MAYVGEQQIKRGDKTYRYYQLVRGYRENGKVKIEVLKHLGRFDSKAEAQAEAGVVTKSNQAPDGEDAVLRKKRNRLRAAARRRIRRVEDVQAAAYLQGIDFTDDDWRKIEGILQEAEHLSEEADKLNAELKRRR